MEWKHEPVLGFPKSAISVRPEMQSQFKCKRRAQKLAIILHLSYTVIGYTSGASTEIDSASTIFVLENHFLMNLFVCIKSSC
jgi:hypothetical protein